MPLRPPLLPPSSPDLWPIRNPGSLRLDRRRVEVPQHGASASAPQSPAHTIAAYWGSGSPDGRKCADQGSCECEGSPAVVRPGPASEPGLHRLRRLWGRLVQDPARSRGGVRLDSRCGRADAAVRLLAASSPVWGNDVAQHRGLLSRRKRSG